MIRQKHCSWNAACSSRPFASQNRAFPLVQDSGHCRAELSLRRSCRSAGSSIIAAGIQDKKGENAEIFKKLHIDDCRVELKLKKRCSLFLKAYGFYKNMRNAIHPGVSHSRAGKIN